MCELHALAILRAEIRRTLIKAIAHRQYGGSASSAANGASYRLPDAIPGDAPAPGVTANSLVQSFTSARDTLRS